MMNILKPGKSRPTESADNGRRSFIWKLGAGVSAGVASAVGMAGVQSGRAGNPSLQVALLRAEKSLREFHQAFRQAMDKGRYEEVVGMFADDAEVVFNGGAFRERGQGVSRLFLQRFQRGNTGRTMEPAPGFELAADLQKEVVEVSADLLAARAVFPYSIQVGAPFETETSFASMARLHGEGVHTWWEGGVYRIDYRKEVAGGSWMISRLVYDTRARADYRAGRSYAQPISVARLAMRFPADLQGPDDLV